jgi:hypothetical protein
MSTVRVNGEGEGVLGSSVLAAATTAFASARTDEVARAASRAGRMADGAREALSLLTSADENAAAGARSGALVRHPLRRTGGLAVSAEAEVGVRGKRTRERRIRR